MTTTGHGSAFDDLLATTFVVNGSRASNAAAASKLGRRISITAPQGRVGSSALDANCLGYIVPLSKKRT